MATSQKTKRALEIIPLLLASILPLTISLHLYNRFGTTASSLDALSHLYIPKNVIHNGPFSGIRNIGTVWLPLYHLLLLPFVAIDTLYFTGFAGTILGIIFLFSAIYLMLSLSKKLFAFPYNIFASLCLLLNPYILLYTVSPMTEILTIFLLLFTAYHFSQFLQAEKGMWHLIIGVVLGTLTRYEFYPIPFLILPFFLARLKEKSKNPFLSLLLFSGISFWLLWNELLFSDPFFFFRHPTTKDSVAHLSYAGSIKKTLSHNRFILKELFGYLPIFSAAGILYLLLKRRWKILLPLLLLISPLFLHILLSYSNISLGHSRFFLLSFPGLILFSFSLLSAIGNKSLRHQLLLIFLLSYFLPLFPTYSVINSGENHYKEKINPSHQDINYPAVSQHLRNFRDFCQNLDLHSSFTLIPVNQEFQAISFALRIRPERLFDAYDHPHLLTIMNEPENFCDYILLPQSPSFFCHRFQNYYQGQYFVMRFFTNKEYRRNILSHFKIVRKGKEIELYKRSFAPGGGGLTLY